MKRCLKCENCRHWVTERAAHLETIVSAETEEEAEKRRRVWDVLQKIRAEDFKCVSALRRT
jgi:hypothetical protein